MSCNKSYKNQIMPLQQQDCCTATTGCEFDGSLDNVVSESIYIQKVYDSALFNLQGLRTVQNQLFTPSLEPTANIISVLDIRCRNFFNPCNIDDTRNLIADPETEISGAEFVQRNNQDVRVIGPDGTASERLLYTDTSECDDEDLGTPIFGTQTISISGCITIEIDVLVEDNGNEFVETLTTKVRVAPRDNPLVLTNFFELCLPSVFEGAFLPRFTEFCNISCQPRLATNNIIRDLIINPETGAVRGNLLISICVTCEKKIIVPVQLCVLSTGFPVLAAETAPICTTFPTLFPRQINVENNDA